MIALHGNTEKLKNALINQFNWLFVEDTEQMKRLIRNYFGTEPNDNTYEKLRELVKDIKPEFWMEEAMKIGISKTMHRSVMVDLPNDVEGDVARLYGFSVVSSDDSIHPDFLINEDTDVEEFINAVRKRTTDTTDS